MNTPLHNCCGCSNWASWIRTNVMQESKSCALPLGDSPSKMYLTAEGGYRDSNPGPPEPQSGALTNCAIPTISEPEGIRTPDPRLRRPLLYPAELQTHSVQKSGTFIHKAGDGNRTHVSSLEGWCSTIELHPHINKNRGDRIRTCDLLIPNQAL